MKSVLCFFILIISQISMYAVIDINIAAGDLKNQDGSASLASGSLLVLVASGGDGIFSNSLIAGQYTAGDDAILAVFSANNNLSDGLGSYNSLSNLNVTGLQGNTLELRWFSEITYSQYMSGILTIAGNHYGSYAGGIVGSPNGGDPWVVPTDGTTGFVLNFVTDSLNNSGGFKFTDAKPNSAGYASSTAQAAPEPSTFFLFGIASLGMLWGMRRKTSHR